MSISFPQPERYAPIYIRRSDPNHANGSSTTTAMSATNATTRIWGYRIQPNIRGAISKYAIHTDSNAFAQSSGVGAIKAAIYRLDENGFPSTKLLNSDVVNNIGTSTFSSTVFTPSTNVELPYPLEPLMLCWITNLSSVTISNGGNHLCSNAINLTGGFHPYSASGSHHLDLEITVPTITYASFSFANDFSTHGPTVFTPRNNSSMCNIDWFLAFAK